MSLKPWLINKLDWIDFTYTWSLSTFIWIILKWQLFAGNMRKLRRRGKIGEWVSIFVNEQRVEVYLLVYLIPFIVFGMGLYLNMHQLYCLSYFILKLSHTHLMSYICQTGYSFAFEYMNYVFYCSFITILVNRLLNQINDR